MKAFSFVFLSAFLLVFHVGLSAQVNRGISAAGRRMDDWDNQRRKAERDAMNREMRGKKPTKEELQAAARIKTETREDLEGLQQNYNDIIVKLTGGQTPETSFIAEPASKVNKHASRLKANIVFPKSANEEAATPIEITDDTRTQLREMCARIYEFLTNPMVESPNVLDVESAAKARLSLESVIALSEKLKSM